MRTGPLPRRLHGRLFFEDWMMIDPEYEPLGEAMHAARYDLEHLTQEQAYLILDAAEAYVHLAAHPAGNKLIIDQLRRVRKAVRETP
jgi:hypothetical protein